MNLTLQIPKKSLSKAFLKYRPLKSELDKFKVNLSGLLGKINEIEREENQKNYIRDFLLNTYYKDQYDVNTKDVKDLVIHNGKTNKSSVGVIIEAKRPGNRSEMISGGKLNCKAFQELVLYYLHERIDEKNIDIKYCIVTNIYEWYIFDASYFEKYFYSDKKFVKQYEEWKKGQKVTGDTNLFYNEIAKPFIDRSDLEIQATHFDLRDYVFETGNSNKTEEDNEKKLIALYKLLSPYHLLRQPFADDSNKLDEKFYKELLHIIGLEEVKEGSKHIIRRKEPKNRNSGSLIENAISKLSILDSSDRVSDAVNYGDTSEEKNFNIALELCLTWINRILFLKLLEAQLINYHKHDNPGDYKFLHPQKLKDFDELFSLFHHVLAVPEKERDADVKDKFRFVPYLNSTLFEISQLERETINISSLNDSLKLDVMKGSILDSSKEKITSLTSLEYILKFLDAYDFSSEGTEDVQEENRTLINASVLGKVFEKINGYKDGSIFTPGFITMYMCREAIRLAVTQKFKDKYNWQADNFDDIKNFIADKRSRNDVMEFNEVIDSIKICDPAVGSGHFLVSSLNELIAVKSELGIFADEQGSRITDHDITIEQDELIITDSHGDIFQYEVRSDNTNNGFKVRPESQRLQKTLFHEKQKLIENCLFGVDINPNSVKICMLRLWIELLKNAYYKEPSNSIQSTHSIHSMNSELETLPNIDINIKTGNSLISRFPLNAKLDADLTELTEFSKFGKKEKNIIEQYRNSVRDYKNERDRSKKKELQNIIRSLKNDIRTDISTKDPKLLKINKLKSELDKLENQTGLFEQSKKEQKEQTAKKKKFETELTKLTKEVEDIRSNAIYRNAFEWRFEFPEVLNEEGEYEGFDVVIGNPPYKSLQKMKSEQKIFEALDYKTYSKSSDLYCLFYEKGIQLLKLKGLVSYITSNSWMKTQYGELLRKYLTEKNNPLVLVNIEDTQVFNEATVESNIIIIQKDNWSKNLLAVSLRKDFDIKFSFESYFKLNSIVISDLPSSGWIIGNEIEDILKNKIETGSINLLHYENQIYRGFTTGFNEGFFINTETKENLVKEHEDCKYIIRPALRGKDISKYKYIWKDIWIIIIKAGWTNENKGDEDAEVFFKRKFPSIYNHLKKTGDTLSGKGKGLYNRDDKGDYWWELRPCAYYGEFEKEKILWGELSDEQKFSYDQNGMFSNNTIFFMTGKDLKYLLSIFNSKLSKWYFNTISSSSGMGTNRWLKYKIEQLPIKNISVEEQFPFVCLVDNILNSKKQGKDTTALEDQIDRMVYELYELTEEEMGIVEGKVN